MGDIMRPIPFEELLYRIFSEYKEASSIFSIPASRIFRKEQDTNVEVFGDTCETPLGPAAGPHTQLAQNIIASYLAGGRFIELKTVQQLDNLEIEKPCIDARDECYNTEWSTEYTLPKAYDEYAKAWIILHVLEEIFELRRGKGPSFIFNMSVGYDLAGIKTEKMDTFINRMIDSSEVDSFNTYLAQLKQLLSNDAFLQNSDLKLTKADAAKTVDNISPHISPSVTLSTMHGCPPDEIEAICNYMLEEKNIHTYVKLNPTLLGYDQAREILDSLGYTYLKLSRESFGHDIQYPAAVDMLKRLIVLARSKNLKFGVKLSNTLGSINSLNVLPGDEMYMSGRALFPLTMTVAAKLAEEFDGKLPISYAGGISAFNAREVFETGIRPITLATDLLKPGGYYRLQELASMIEQSKGWDTQKIDVQKVQDLARAAREADFTQKDFRGEKPVKIDEELPLFDCYIAPCRVACPIGQHVPEYVRLTGENRYKEALQVIYRRNALPHITGYICDHQCMYNCTRIDYEGAVEIREMKRIATENSWAELRANFQAPAKKGLKTAVIGAGPAGLAAAYFLARQGCDVTVFEKHDSAGGVVRHVIPGFRLPQEAIEKDIDYIKAHGVDFQFNVKKKLTVDELKAQGFKALFLAVGAEKDNPLSLPGGRVIRSLDFLSLFRKNTQSLSLGEHVAVVGGGNTAMDSARAAFRVPGVSSVTLVYRRTKAEMPADLEEFNNALKEGVEVKFLRNPESFNNEGLLVCRVMELGAADASGRKKPQPTDDTETIKADTVITAIGEQVDNDLLKSMGVPLNQQGLLKVDPESLETEVENVYLIGDAHTGPSTVVRCISEGRLAAEHFLAKELPGAYQGSEIDGNSAGLLGEKHYKANYPGGLLGNPAGIRDSIIAARGAMIPPARQGESDGSFASVENRRCLQCSYVCDKCVEVCPNRANVVISMEDQAGPADGTAQSNGFNIPHQIVHLDAPCNECGNCATFCPWQGKPYVDKLTLFSLAEDFENSKNSGFLIENEQILVRRQSKVYKLPQDQQHIDARIIKVIEKIQRDHAYLLSRVGH